MRFTGSTKTFLIKTLYFLAPTIIFCFAYQDPFFGDAISTTSRAAVEIYVSGFRSLFYPEALDPGHPTLLPTLLAFFWLLTGKSLWAAHVFSAFWGGAVLWITDKICVRLGYDLRRRIFALLLLSALPYFIAQNAMILTHLPLTFFYLLLCYAVLTKKQTLFIFSGILLFLTHLQAAFLFLSVGLAELYISLAINKQNLFLGIKQNFVRYIIPLIALSAWLIVHYNHTGWWVVAPQYATHRAPAVHFSTFALALGTSLWRLADFATPALWLAVFIALQKKIAPRETGVFTFVTAGTLAVGIAYFAGASIAHRYFLPPLVWACVAAAPVLSSRPFWAASLLVFLLGSSAAYYPGKCIGDATLAYRNYFSIEKEIAKDFAGDTLYSYAPHANLSRYTYLTETPPFYVARLYESNLDTVPYVLETNCACDFSAQEKERLAKNFKGVSYESGGVFANIYTKNRPLPANKTLRKKGKFETILEDWKKKLKPK